MIFVPFQPAGLQFYENETPTQLFSCEICNSLKKAYFEEHLRMAASDNLIYIILLSLGITIRAFVIVRYTEQILLKRDKNLHPQSSSVISSDKNYILKIFQEPS